MPKNKNHPGPTDTKTEMMEIRSALLTILQNEKAVDEWLETPRMVLDNTTPNEQIAKGNSGTVMDLINRMRHGIFS